MLKETGRQTTQTEYYSALDRCAACSKRRAGKLLRRNITVLYLESLPADRPDPDPEPTMTSYFGITHVSINEAACYRSRERKLFGLLQQTPIKVFSGDQKESAG